MDEKNPRSFIPVRFRKRSNKNGKLKEKSFEMVVGGLHTENELMEMLGFIPER